ncbi:MAG TPA: TIGR02757 family protein [Thermodesulfovibrio thiophilus]|uniref:TIGR02757 family protein n=1 Tax=Thermodesulfovibrio thiophilus TaxID=340095 RepID=UPI0017F581F0|nr:TIGR02757 family protein [Thermodesulfovibrio thiophilus]HHW20377.1 TIGR02757 family protein [Thermodesulfovibrio thiophilus]HQD35689.1 TIGR02757 family protein [Thermodesulfovibrio thiophilus]
MNNLKEMLENLYSGFNFEEAVQNDPIKFPKKYTEKEDIEVSAFVASSFAYGSIKVFCRFLETLFMIMGQSPFDFLMNFNAGRFMEKLDKKYRFNSVHDIAALLFIIRSLLQQSSFESYFISNSIVNGISNFVSRALAIDLTAIYGRDIKTRGLIHFFSHPAKLSPCKRINLFLRWMVRDQDVDFGLWKNIKPSDLIIPLDVHIWKVSKELGLTKKINKNLKTAIEITEFLKKINSEDPLKYDFVLCHSHMKN